MLVLLFLSFFFFFGLNPRSLFRGEGLGTLSCWLVSLSRGFAYKQPGKDHCENTMIFSSVPELFCSVSAPFREKKIILGYFGLQFFRTSITNHKANLASRKFLSN